MLQCKNCGEFSEDGSSFCEHCGGSFEVIDNRNKSTKSVGVYSFLALIVVMLLTWGVTVSHKRTVISNATDIADKEYAEYQLSECFFY